MTAAQELIRLVSPPGNIQESPNWAHIEGRLGWQLPTDYKWLVGAYGPGVFDEFIHVLQPGTEFEPISLVGSCRRAVEILHQLKSGGEDIPYEVRELAPVAKTDNGDTVYWVRRPEDSPDSWSVVANSARGHEWPKFDGGIVEFLTAVLSGRYRVPIFPEDFPDPQPKFDQYGARELRSLPDFGSGGSTGIFGVSDSNGSEVFSATFR